MDYIAERAATLEQRAKEKSEAGRYSLDDAANFFSDNAKYSRKSMLTRLKESVLSGKLTAYLPGMIERYEHKSNIEWRNPLNGVDEWYAEIYWNDLNEWLKNNVPRSDFKFPDPNAPAAVEQAAPAKPTAKVGRPKTIEKKANAVRQTIELFEKTAGIKFNPQDLPGSAADLLDACKRFEKSNKIKPLIYSVSQDTFNGWLKSAGYSFPTGRPLDIEKNYWTQLVVKVTA